VEGKSSSGKTYLGKTGAGFYHGNAQLFTRATVEQAVQEIEGVWRNAAILEYTVTFGNGKTKSRSVRNSSLASISVAFNGAVALAVIDIMNDLEVREHINQ
jgi:hypothetical protein